MYTYVRQNPWTSFDPEGLAAGDYSNTTTPAPPKQGIPHEIRQKAAEVTKNPPSKTAKGV
jgi:hypothetical protein